MAKLKCPVWSRVENKKEGKMYGLLLESVQYYVIQDVGEETWNKILEYAGVKNTVFTTHDTYRDELMTLLAESCCHVTKTKDYNQWMTFFGQCFVDFCRSYGYDKLLRVTGRSYRDFLHGIDNIHEVIRFSYPRLQSPAFLVLSEDCDGCVMLYQTKRRGFKHYVIGQLQQVAKRFYNISVNISVVEEELIDRKTHVKFRLDFDNSAFKPKPVPKQCSGIQQFSVITGDTFLKVFPFCIVFNSQLVIRMVGSSMIALLNGENLIGSRFREKFHIRRPLIPCLWSKILQFQRVIFEVEYIGDNKLSELDSRLIENEDQESEKSNKQRVLLRGEMKFLKEWNMISFLCTPLLCDLKDLQNSGLYINDLNAFDMSRDMVMAGWQHASQLERSIEEQRGKSKKIECNMVKIEEWKEKSDSLLYNMIPKSVASKLKSGQDPISTCEVFDNVTIMFNYMVGFGDVCSSATPMKIVEIINSVFSLFDEITDTYDVFKVETLGDAVYMVAGGVPDRNPNHAVNVAGLALDLQERAKSLADPWVKEYKLSTRIGMHTGSVVGGVVGRRMPQYCLFGDTVNTASRMQTYSLPGRIHISEPTQQCLKQSSFVTIVRGTVNVKGKGEMRTFWLAGKEGEERTRKFCEEIKQERNEAVRKYSSYENAMDLHAMHASTSFAQLPAYFGGLKSSRSASTISLSSMQQTDNTGSSENKPIERLGIKPSPKSSFSRLNECTEVHHEIDDENEDTPIEFLSQNNPRVCIDLADDNGNKADVKTGGGFSNAEATAKASKRDEGRNGTGAKSESKTRWSNKSTNNTQSKYGIPQIVEYAENVDNGKEDDNNDTKDKEKRPTLTKIKLSLPKLTDLSRFMKHGSSPKTEQLTESETDNKGDANQANTEDTRNTTPEIKKFNVFLGSDDCLSEHNIEDAITKEDSARVDKDTPVGGSPKVSFSISKSETELLTDVFYEAMEDIPPSRKAQDSNNAMFDNHDTGLERKDRVKDYTKGTDTCKRFEDNAKAENACNESTFNGNNDNDQNGKVLKGGNDEQTQSKSANSVIGINNDAIQSEKANETRLGDTDKKQTGNILAKAYKENVEASSEKQTFNTHVNTQISNNDISTCDSIFTRINLHDNTPDMDDLHPVNLFTNGYLSDADNDINDMDKTLSSRDGKLQAETKVDDKMHLGILSCPMFTILTNGVCDAMNGDDDVHCPVKLRKCKSDVGCKSENHIESTNHRMSKTPANKTSIGSSVDFYCKFSNSSPNHNVCNTCERGVELGKYGKVDHPDKRGLFDERLKVTMKTKTNTDAFAKDKNCDHKCDICKVEGNNNDADTCRKS